MRAVHLTLVSLGIIGMLATAVPAQAEYLAYAITGDDEERPLPESLDAIAGKKPIDLLRIRWSDYPGARTRIRVLTTENQAAGGVTAAGTGPNGESWSYNVNTQANEVPVQGLDAILQDVLMQTGRFDVVQRGAALDAILEEQDLGASGAVASPSAAKTGQILGAQYGVKLVVNKYEPDVKGKKAGGGFGKWLPGRARAVAGGVNWKKAESLVNITVQIVNIETTLTEHSKQVEVRLKDSGIAFGGATWGSAGALGGFFGTYSKTPLGQAMIAAVNVGVYDVVKKLASEARPVEGKVAAVVNGTVYTTLTEGQVAPGDAVTVVSLGEPIINPDTGQIIDRNERVVGQLQITTVDGNSSKATAVGNLDPASLETGDVVRSEKAPPVYEFGTSWI